MVLDSIDISRLSSRESRNSCDLGVLDRKYNSNEFDLNLNNYSFVYLKIGTRKVASPGSREGTPSIPVRLVLSFLCFCHDEFMINSVGVCSFLEQISRVVNFLSSTWDRMNFWIPERTGDWCLLNPGPPFRNAATKKNKLKMFHCFKMQILTVSGQRWRSASYRRWGGASSNRLSPSSRPYQPVANHGYGQHAFIHCFRGAWCVWTSRRLDNRMHSKCLSTADRRLNWISSWFT